MQRSLARTDFENLPAGPDVQTIEECPRNGIPQTRLRPQSGGLALRVAKQIFVTSTHVSPFRHGGTALCTVHRAWWIVHDACARHLAPCTLHRLDHQDDLADVLALLHVAMRICS